MNKKIETVVKDFVKVELHAMQKEIQNILKPLAKEKGMSYEEVRHIIENFEEDVVAVGIYDNEIVNAASQIRYINERRERLDAFEEMIQELIA